MNRSSSPSSFSSHSAFPPRHRRSAFSLVEVLTGVVLLAIVATVSVIALTGTDQGVRRTKLDTDVRSLNSAVDIYRASSGDLSGVTSAAEVLARLKAVATADSSKKIAGLTGSMVDHRLMPEMQTPEQAASGEARAVWNPAEMRFVIQTSGEPGIRQFLFDESQSSDSPQETRDPSLELATVDDWIWDYENRAAGVVPGPTPVTVSPSTPSTAPGTSPVPPGSFPSDPPTWTPPSTLSPPAFSIPSGNYPVTDFPMSLTLSDPNPAGSSTLFYSVDGGTWTAYAGAPLPLTKDTSISARAVATDSTRWRNSSTANEIYAILPVTLDPPVISPDSDLFTPLIKSVLVSLSNPNDSDVSQVVYRINGGSWTSYGLPFLLQRLIYRDGASIEAKAVPTADYYLESPIAFAYVGDVLDRLKLSGELDGEFQNPVLESSGITNLGSSNPSDPRFTWGTQSSSVDRVSEMTFTGLSFSNVAMDSLFKLGELSYYNGTIRTNTGASMVDLAIALDLSYGSIHHFDFSFALINTPNVSGDVWTSADYVQIANPVADTLFTNLGSQYRLRLQFGETSTYGFSTFDQFHVQENQGASVNLYGVFELIE